MYSCGLSYKTQSRMYSLLSLLNKETVVICIYLCRLRLGRYTILTMIPPGVTLGGRET